MIEGISDILGFPPVKFGFGAIRELAGLSIERGMARPLIITDKGLVEHGVLKKLIDAQPANFSFVVFDDIPPNPTVAGILAAADVYKAEGCDGIIGLGGGSVLDSGKALRVAVSHPGPFISYLKPDAKIGPDVPPYITIPTTAGTGAEITLASGIHPDEHTRAIGLRSPYIKPDIAICDPDLTISLPPFLTAATGLDALSHCLEAYFSVKIDPVLESVAIDGLRRIASYIERATKDGQDREARWHMQLAGLQGGMAIYKGLGPVHAIANTLGDEGLHHGVLCSVATPPVLRFYEGKLDDRLKCVALALSGSANINADKAVENLIDRLELPNSLKKLGYQNRDLENMATDAFASYFNKAARHVPSRDDYRMMFAELLDR